MSFENTKIARISRCSKIILLLLFSPVALLVAQPSLQTNIWYFGNHAGLDFNSGVPVPLTNGALSTLEGTASISDRNTGRLLFYTDGTTVYDSTHAIMPNGNGLLGHPSSTQSGVIVPDPANDSLYYIFAVGAQAGFVGPYGGVSYSVVDMRLNGGLGDITTKNVLLVNPATEKISAVRHCNGHDVWVLTHQWNSNAFYAYLVTGAGVQPPVISNVGIVHQNIGSTNNSEAIGYMKVAPDQQHIGLSTFFPLNTIELFHFDNVLGIVSNQIFSDYYPPMGTYGGPYGCSFSPDGSKFYAAYHNYAGSPNYVYQYDLSLPDTAIAASKFMVASTSAVSNGALQLASDGKMYMATFSNNSFGGPVGSPTIDCFNNPNGLHFASGWVPNAVFLNGGFSIWGLPDYIESYFSPPAVTNFNDTSFCTGGTANFNPTYEITLDSISWNFDDPASGALNYSTLPAPSHTYNSAGVYLVNLIVHYNCHHDTITRTVTVTDLAIWLGNDTTLCNGNNVTLDPNYPAAIYLWSNGTTNQTINVSTGGSYWLQVTDGPCISRDTIVVTFNPPPVVALGNDTTICSDQALTLNAGNPGSAYLWNNGSTTQTISPTTSGPYWVTADLTGCTDSDTMQLTVVQLPNLFLGNDTVLCNGQALSISAVTVGYSYTWSTGSTLSSISVTTTNTYWVEIDNGVCDITDTINVQFNPPPVVALGNDTTICNGQQVTLDAGNAGAAYLWSTGATTQTIAVTVAGNYTVEADLTGCKDSDSLTVTVNQSPPLFLGNDTVLCQGEVLQLNASAAGYSNLWSTGSTASSINVNIAGNYWVQLDDGICNVLDTIGVAFDIPPVVAIGNDTTLCIGQAFMLDAGVPAASYLWNTGATTQTINVTASGNYTVNVTSGACTRADSMQATFNAPLAIDLGTDTIRCVGDSITLNAGLPGYVYLWSTGATTQAITVNTTGVYNFQLFDGICTSFDSIGVTFVAYPVVQLGNDTSFCSNTVLTLDAGNPGADYLWSTGETTQTMQPAAAGSYWVTAAYYDCPDADTIDINILPAPDVNLGNDTALCPGDVVVLNAGNPGAQILWDDGDISHVRSFTSIGTYMVTVTSINGCTDADTIELNTHGCEFYLFVPNTFSPNSDTKNDFYQIVPYNVLHVKVLIFNRWGQTVYKSDQFLPGWDGTYRNVVCPEDVYAVIIDYDGLDETGNLVKRRKNTSVLLLR